MAGTAIANKTRIVPSRYTTIGQHIVVLGFAVMQDQQLQAGLCDGVAPSISCNYLRSLIVKWPAAYSLAIIFSESCL